MASYYSWCASCPPKLVSLGNSYRPVYYLRGVSFIGEVETLPAVAYSSENIMGKWRQSPRQAPRQIRTHTESKSPPGARGSFVLGEHANLRMHAARDMPCMK